MLLGILILIMKEISILFDYSLKYFKTSFNCIKNSSFFDNLCDLILNYRIHFLYYIFFLLF